MEGGPFEFAAFVKNFRNPVVPLSRRFDIAQHGADVNRLAAIATVIFAKPFHAENFTQRRQDAKQNCEFF